MYLYPFDPIGNILLTIVQYHNQGIDIDTVKLENISITTRIFHFAFLKPHPFSFYLQFLLNSWQPLICYFYNFVIQECH